MGLKQADGRFTTSADTDSYNAENTIHTDETPEEKNNKINSTEVNSDEKLNKPGHIEVDPGTARRNMPTFDGVYIDGEIQGIEVTFTVDTGATTTIVSPRVYDKIPVDRRPSLSQGSNKRSLSNAEGKPMDCRGKATFQIQLGSLRLEKQLIVADITDEVLLGSDILQKDPSGPADILLSENRMILKDTSITLHQVGLPTPIRRVTAADHYIIPGMSEVVIDVFVERSHVKNHDESEDTHLLIEPTTEFTEKYSLAVAPTLVDATSSTTVKTRVMNPFCEPVSIKQDTVIGHASEVEEPIHTIVLEETEGEHDCLDSVRRIPLATGIISESLRQVTSDKTNMSTEIIQEKVPEHLLMLYEDTISTRPEDEHEAIAKLLIENQDCFSRNEYDLGRTHLVEHTIPTGDAKPIKQAPRRTPLAFANEEKGAIEKLLKQGTIRPSTSPWSSPLVFVRKKSLEIRPCVDYRKVNAVTVKDAFPLPRVQDCLDAVAGSKIYSTIDITSAYNQVPVKKEDIPKTAFVSKFGLFEYVTMPFGLSNSCATFQRLMELALNGLQWTSSLIFLDDVVIHAKTVSENMQRLSEVLQRISQSGLKLKPQKCNICKEEVKFLGHIISGNGVLPDPDNIAKLLKWPIPKTPTDVRAFLGLGNYYRRHIKDFSKRVATLINLTKKDKAFTWTDKCQESFDDLKQVLTSPEVMAYPQDEGEFILDTDACDVSIGAVLSQIQNGVERVVAYGSKTISKSERNYCVTDRELLAVKHFVCYYKHYLLGRKFKVRTDHQALKWLFSLKEPKNRIARWIEILSEFNFEVEYRPGKQHSNADAMSRCPNPRDCQCEESGNIEALKCGPCKKCWKRADDMESSMLVDESKLRRIRRDSCDQAGGQIWRNATCKAYTVMIWLMCIMGVSQVFKGTNGKDDEDGNKVKWFQGWISNKRMSEMKLCVSKFWDTINMMLMWLMRVIGRIDCHKESKEVHEVEIGIKLRDGCTSDLTESHSMKSLKEDKRVNEVEEGRNLKSRCTSDQAVGHLMKSVIMWIVGIIKWMIYIAMKGNVMTMLMEQTYEILKRYKESDEFNNKMMNDGRFWPKLKEKAKVVRSYNISIWVQQMTEWIYNLSNKYRCCRVTRNSGVCWALPYSLTVLQKRQLQDSDIGPILRWKQNDEKPFGSPICAASPATRHYWCNWDRLEIRNGVLFREFHRRDATGCYLQFLVPRTLREEIIKQMHNCVLSGHLGAKKTREKLLQKFYWFGVREDVNNWVFCCDECGATKAPNKKPKAPLGSMPVGAPLDRLSTDVLGPLPESNRGNKFILVVSDHFTKWVEIFAIPDYTAATCANKILNEVIARFGCPYAIHSDQGSNYESLLFAELCRLLEIRKTRTSAGNPQCNGQTERFNRTLIRMIKAYLKGQQRDWDLNLGCLSAAYRATPQESTGLTPNLLMLGREVRLPAEVMFGSGTTHIGEEITSYGQYVSQLRDKMHHAHIVAREHLQKAAVRQKQSYDAKQNLQKYTVGELVWYLTGIKQLKIAPKLRNPYDGPFLVVEKLSDLDYRIQLDAKGTRKVVHHNKLKSYNGNIRLKWATNAIQKKY